MSVLLALIVGVGALGAGGAPATAQATLAPHAVRGVATWYCWPGRSACPVGWRAAGLYAAAGPALRRALGRHWQGRYVAVTAGGRRVVVRLVDWCSCPGGRVIDLFAVAFRRLAPTSRGIVAVVVVPR